MLTGVVYWAVWRILLPKFFGYTLVPRKQVLEDGTVVNVVCTPLFGLIFMTLNTLLRL